jgi:peptide/nickel transport system permease protein
VIGSKLTFVTRRLAAGVFAVWAMVTITFFIFWAIPSEPATFVYPNVSHLSDEQIQKAHHLLGIDRPLLTQYGDYLWHLLHFDFGGSWDTLQVNVNQRFHEAPIKPILIMETRETLSIIIGDALLVLLLAIPLGAIAGRRVGSLTDRTISLIALIAVCTHPMVVALMLRTFFGDRLHWLPPTGYCQFGHFAGNPCSGPVPWAEHLILPWITFALLFLALYVRMIRTSVHETLQEDFIRTARAKGVSENRIMQRHVLPNAGITILTMIGMEIATAIGVCVYIEAAFGIYGLGNATIQAMFGTLDLPRILGIVTVITVIVVVGNLIVDILYVVIDPRAGTARREGRTKSLAGGVI